MLSHKLNNLPQSPGVYLMKDKSNNVIYVGKAKNLKNRVSSYFQKSKQHSQKVKFMVPQITDLDLILTDNEIEALILECNLIKKYHPYFNVKLKDDKHYPYIMITLEDKYPAFYLTRKINKDKNKYFGPYPGAYAVKHTIDTLKRGFNINTCKKKKGQPDGKPCLYYQIGRCRAFCQNTIDEKEYRETVRQAIRFLNGQHKDILGKIKTQMEEASANMEFEKAATFRDQLHALEKVMENQKIISDSLEDQDVIALSGDNDDMAAQVFFIRGGKLMGSEHFFIEDVGDEDRADVLEAFIKQFYSMAAMIPKVILLQDELNDEKVIEKWLEGLRGNRVYIHVPQKGEKKKLVQMAEMNACDAMQNMEQKLKKEKERTIGAIEELQKILSLDVLPQRIEGYDISNIQGTETTASMVVFVDGKAKNTDYRHFRIKTVDGQNDFASMAEVIARRFKRGIEEKKKLISEGKGASEGKFSQMPDLVLIDGGKGQLSAAREIMKRYGVGYIPTIGLAKRMEEIFQEGRDEAIILPGNSKVLHLLQRIRDEAHRFAISYHRSLRKKDGLRSVLEDVPGIGKKRAALLLIEYGSIDKIRNTKAEEMAKIKGMTITAARQIKEYLG